MAVAAVLAPWLTPYDPSEIDLREGHVLLSPSWEHPFGTDESGRDWLARALYGARVSLAVGAGAMSFAVLVGTVVGVVAGYFRGVVDAILMRGVDTMLALPLLFVLLAAQSILEPSTGQLVFLIGLTAWMNVARVVRAETMRVTSLDFVEAAVALGASDVRCVLRHVLPNLFPAIGVAASLSVAHAILAEAALSYLGLGVPPPEPSWGSMLQDGLTRLQTAPWLVVFPGLLITGAVFAFYSVAEGGRSRLRARVGS